MTDFIPDDSNNKRGAGQYAACSPFIRFLIMGGSPACMRTSSRSVVGKRQSGFSFREPYLQWLRQEYGAGDDRCPETVFTFGGLGDVI